MKEWLSDKTLQLRVFNLQIDFGLENNPFREHEYWLSSVSLKPDQFTEVGLRYRRNSFTMNDYWLPFFSSTEVQFYDVQTYNDYHYSLPGDHKYLAEIFFRLDVNEVIHYRRVYGIADWLSTIAGIDGFLTRWISFVVGGWL